DSTSKIINSTVIANNATLAPELSIVDNSSGDIGGDTGDDTGGTEEPETPVPSAVELGITFGRGGGFYSLSSKSEVIDSVFKGNAASASGGGIFFIGSDQDYGYESIVKNSLIAGNSSGRDGAGISVNWYSDIDIANSTIADNVVTGARSIGGGLYTSYSSVSDITNSIIWGNTAIEGSQLAVNGGNLFFPYPSTIGVTYSDVQAKVTSVRPEAIDLVFLIDTTGSMGDDIDAVRIAIAEILDRIAEYFPDYRIAVVDYRDYPEDPYGSEGVDYLYSDKTEFTSNPVRIQAAIDALTLGSGMDWRESVYSGLMHCIINDEVDVDAIGYVEGDPLTHTYVHSLGGWRTGDEVKRVIVLMADAPPHEPEPYGEFYSSDVVIEAA
ncbi:MAG: hypothetical protein KAT00_15325, partial [Planctomycetes bacterium]|nr:hypothetical protein [Planctomycetota bacterium]